MVVFVVVAFCRLALFSRSFVVFSFLTTFLYLFQVAAVSVVVYYQSRAILQFRLFCYMAWFCMSVLFFIEHFESYITSGNSWYLPFFCTKAVELAWWPTYMVCSNDFFGFYYSFVYSRFSFVCWFSMNSIFIDSHATSTKWIIYCYICVCLVISLQLTKYAINFLQFNFILFQIHSDSHDVFFISFQI